jgi:hypothetical protein
MHIYVRNTGSTARTIAIPTTGSYVSMNGSGVTLPASGYVEISVVYNANIAKYIIAAITL